MLEKPEIMPEKPDVAKSRRRKCADRLRGCTYGVVEHTESFFYRLGVLVGNHPFRTIALCWAIVILCSFGFLRFRQERNPLKLWVPPRTSFIRDSEWLMSSLQIGYQEEVVLFTDEDVLRPEVIQKIYSLDQKVRYARSSKNLTLKDVCFMIPKVNKGLLKLLDRFDPKSDPSKKVHTAIYCHFVEKMKKECYTKSILDLWEYDEKIIMNLTKDDIIEAVNSKTENILGHLKSSKDLLGTVTKNDTGHIVAAKAIYNYWYLTKNFSAIDIEKTGNYAGTGDWATDETIDWEGLFLEIMDEYSQSNQINYYAGRSFGDISNAVLFQDIDKLALGIMIMIIYIQLVISKFNWVEARIVLGFVGLLSIGMSFVVGAGICSLFGIPYGPVHTSLPFLLMGLGVDDMFVILSCWEGLTKEEKKLPTPEKIGLMLKHAGVSITITSCTDVIAFLIGSSTILPCLESFCIYAAAGVLMTFIFAVTFFVACFVLDDRRIRQNRNGAVPWIVHENHKPNACSQRNFTNYFFNKLYSNVILTTPGKITVIAISIICAGFGLEGTLKLKQHFDLAWFVPDDTHLGRFYVARDAYYPENGFDAGLYMGSVNYSYEMPRIKQAVDELMSYSNITENVISWVDPFRDFVLYNYQHDIFKEPLDDGRFNSFLSKFLMSPQNARYQANFVFEKELECGVPAPNIKLSTIMFHFKNFNDPKKQIPAMHQVRDVVARANFTTGDKIATVWSKFFSTWITDELIDVEVMRNLQLALLCVMLCTIVLIADWRTCCLIFFCVLITMVDVCGFMERWGLTIDLVSCIGLELAIGLCVDYATHVGHTFLTIAEGEGGRRERAVKAVSSIGSAVLYGGLSTFIGVFMMSQSKAYTFKSFFKIFFLVILFGLFHGIVLLPVILSMVGPKPYPMHKKSEINKAQQESEMKPLDS